jgi:hypothetical protein
MSHYPARRRLTRPGEHHDSSLADTNGLDTAVSLSVSPGIQIQHGSLSQVVIAILGARGRSWESYVGDSYRARGGVLLLLPLTI